MATNRFTGGASAIAQVSTVTITADDVTTTYKLTINGKVISTLGTGVSTTATAAALAAAWAASTAGEALEVVATSSVAVVTLTGKSDGTPFTVTSSVSGGAGTIGAVTAV